MVGPDLSRIGAARSRAALVSRIREGSRPRSGSGFAPVTFSTEDGEAIRGVTKNEDLFSIQIMEVEGRIQGFDKERLDALDKPVDSLMPLFGPDRLNEGELNDLVSYLQTLRGFDPAGAIRGRTNAIDHHHCLEPATCPRRIDDGCRPASRTR